MQALIFRKGGGRNSDWTPPKPPVSVHRLHWSRRKCEEKSDSGAGIFLCFIFFPFVFNVFVVLYLLWDEDAHLLICLYVPSHFSQRWLSIIHLCPSHLFSTSLTSLFFCVKNWKSVGILLIQFQECSFWNLLKGNLKGVYGGWLCFIILSCRFSIRAFFWGIHLL